MISLMFTFTIPPRTSFYTSPQGYIYYIVCQILGKGIQMCESTYVFGLATANLETICKQARIFKCISILPCMTHETMPCNSKYVCALPNAHALGLVPINIFTKVERSYRTCTRKLTKTMQTYICLCPCGCQFLEPFGIYT